MTDSRIVRARRACPVCAGTAVTYLHRQRFVLADGHPLAAGYDVACCRGCGFVYADVAATQADYDAFYAAQSKYADPASTGSGEAPYDRERLAATAATIAGALPDRGARILDVGCAGGGLLAALAQLGYRDLVGVDPSAACAAQTRERVGQAYQGWLTALPADLGTFDCVVLCHVLEHVLDVPEALTAVAELLRPAGLAYVEVPDAERYAEHVHAPFQDFNTEHVNHFSRQCLDSALARLAFAAIGGGRRLLHASAVTYTPAVYGLYRRAARPADPVRDAGLERAIGDYIARSASLLARISERIDQALAESPELVIWGAGQLTLKLLAETRLSEARIAAVVDSNPIHHCKRLAGAEIVPPAALRAYPQPILIGTLLHHQAIQAQIAALGLPNRLILLPEL